MKKMFSFVFTCLISLSLMSCTNSNSDGQMNKEVSIDGFVKEDDAFLTKIHFDQELFSFINLVHVPSGYSWSLYRDFEGKDEITTKTIKCNTGSNSLYMLVRNATETIGFYDINIYRLSMFTVSFYTCGGTYVPNQSVEEESLAERPNEPTKTGYTFVNWDYDFSTPITKDTTINAIWDGNVHIVTFDVNGGDELPNTTLEVKNGIHVTLPTPEKIGYSFDGWYLENTKVSSGIWEIDKDVTLIAKWNAKKYQIQYNPNGGEVETNNGNYSRTTFTDEVYFDSDYQLKNGKKDGYYLEGWFVDNETKLESGKWTIDSNVSATARWGLQKYTITYDVNGGNELESDTQEVLFNSEFELVTPTRKGYTFDGWYYGNTLVESGIWTFTSNVRLVAKWSNNSYIVSFATPSTAAKYKVVFDLNYDDLVKEMEFSCVEPLEIYVPSRNNYFFCGWFKDKDLTEFYDFKSPLLNNSRLYAKWVSQTLTYFPKIPGYSWEGEAEYKVWGGGPSYQVIGVIGFEQRNYKLVIEASGPEFDVTKTVRMQGVTDGPVDTQRTISLISTETLGNGHVVKTYSLSDVVKGDVNTFGFLRTTKTSLGQGVTIYSICIDGSFELKSCLDSTDSSGTLACVYDEEYNLGVPQIIPNGKNFIGWYTGENGTGTRLTNGLGDSLTNWNNDEKTIVYPYFS